MVKHEPADVRRLQLFNAATEVCAEKGYAATRVDDIAAEAGLSKGALYHHFKGKRDLFIQLFEFMMVEMERETLQAIESMTSAADAFRLINESYAQMVQVHPAMMRGILDFYMSNYRDDEVRQIFLGFYERLTAAITRLIQRGMDQGEFDDSLDAEEVTWTWFTAGDGLLFLHFYFHQEDLGVQRMQTLIEIFLRGIKSKPAEEARS